MFSKKLYWICSLVDLRWTLVWIKFCYKLKIPVERPSLIDIVSIQTFYWSQCKIMEKHLYCFNNFTCFLEKLISTTVKPLNSGSLRVFKNLSVTERYPLLGGNLKKDCHIWDSTFCPLFMACPLFGISAFGRFHYIFFYIQFLIENPDWFPNCNGNYSRLMTKSGSLSCDSLTHTIFILRFVCYTWPESQQESRDQTGTL